METLNNNIDLDFGSPSFKPRNYIEMDGWLNYLPTHAWLGIVGAYTAGGYSNVIDYLRSRYADNLEKWKDKDLRHYLNCRELSDFNSRFERRNNARSAYIG